MEGTGDEVLLQTDFVVEMVNGPIPCNASRPPLADGTPPDAELRAAVKKLRNGRTDDGSNMRAEDIKSWLRGMGWEKKAAKEGKEGHKGAGDTWRLFVRLLQHVWDTGEIP